MGTDDDKEPSFDARTWLRLAKPDAESVDDSVPVGQEPQTPSFDPRSWASASKINDLSETLEAVTTKSGASNSGPREPVPKRLFLVAGLSAVLGAVALSVFLWPRHPAGEATENVDAADRQGGGKRSLTVENVQALESALVGFGIDAASAAKAVGAVRSELGGEGSLRVVLQLNRTSTSIVLSHLEARRENGEGVRLQASEAGQFDATRLAAETTIQARLIRGQMDAESFYTSAVAQGLTDNLILPFAQVFTYDFDFQREIAPGDVFEAVIEQARDAIDRPVGEERLVYVALQTQAKSLAFYQFSQGDEGGWYDGAGRSVVRSLLRTPVEGARLSSSFGMRTHPILGYQRLHRGADFAAATGTPVYASGDGVVEVAENRGANGNMVIIRHTQGWRTYYLHLNAFAPAAKAGASVRQGVTIGEVGTTGRSTGPHLHYEVHTESGAIDPMSIQVEAGRTLQGSALAAFIVERDRIDRIRVERVD